MKNIDHLLNRHYVFNDTVVAWTDQQAPGALPNGTRVEKCNSVPRDTHQDGAQASIIGSVGLNGVYAYFVHWDDHPGVPVVLASMRAKVIP